MGPPLSPSPRPSPPQGARETQRYLPQSALQGGGLGRGWDQRFFPPSQPSPALGGGDFKSPYFPSQPLMGK
jgi:hypothetical protein